MLLVTALVAGFLAVRQSNRAEQSATSAAAAQTSSDARAAGARALVTDDIDTSMLLAVAGVRLDDSPATQSSLLAALGKHPELIASTQLDGKAVLRFDVSPDGRTVATYDEAHRVRLYEIESGELLAQFQAGSDERLGWLSGNIEFSPDGSTLAVVTAAPTRQPVTLLDAWTLQLRRRPARRCPAMAVAGPEPHLQPRRPVPGRHDHPRRGSSRDNSGDVDLGGRLEVRGPTATGRADRSGRRRGSGVEPRRECPVHAPAADQA